MARHYLKIVPEYFALKIAGRKFWECRVNDRDFQNGDTLILREFDGKNYTGRWLETGVQYVHKISDAKDCVVILSETFLQHKLTYDPHYEPEK